MVEKTFVLLGTKAAEKSRLCIRNAIRNCSVAARGSKLIFLSTTIIIMVIITISIIIIALFEYTISRAIKKEASPSLHTEYGTGFVNVKKDIDFASQIRARICNHTFEQLLV